jgi:hypothetical protein
MLTRTRAWHTAIDGLRLEVWHAWFRQWQGGYGVVSFGTRDLPWVVAYIENQREHHARGTIHERLERVEKMESVAEAGVVKARERA